MIQIVTDQGADFHPSQTAGLTNIHRAPFRFTIGGRTYWGDNDIDQESFYRVLRETRMYPTTAPPSPPVIAEIYKRAGTHEDAIVGIHISSGLSKTMERTQEALDLIPRTAIHLHDSRVLSAAQGWQVIDAARAAQRGCSVSEILARAAQIRDATDIMFTLATLRYLTHGGRINRVRGTLGELAGIKPILAVNKATGTYYQRGLGRTLHGAVRAMTALIAAQYPRTTRMRFQLMHGANLADAEALRGLLAAHYADAVWLPTVEIAAVLAAHTGAGAVGLAYAAEDALPV